MTDKIVTHADLEALRNLRTIATGSAERERLVDRLIAAAEADAPPLPEGWVVRKNGGAHWYKGGQLFLYPNGPMTYTYQDLKSERHRLTPLRPTITEADVVAATHAAFDAHRDAPEFSDAFALAARAAFKAAGIEVQP